MAAASGAVASEPVRTATETATAVTASKPSPTAIAVGRPRRGTFILM